MSTQSSSSSSYLPLLARYFSHSHSHSLSVSHFSPSTHFAGGIKCDVGIYVDENHIVYTNLRGRSREYTCAPSVRCAWASGTYCCPSNPVSLSTTTHAITHAYHGQTVRPSPACRSTLLWLARSLRFPRSCRCRIHERNECRETIHRTCRSCCLLDPRPLPLSPNVSSSSRPGVLYRQYI